MVDAGTFRSGQARWKGPKFQKSSFFIAEALSLPAESDVMSPLSTDRIQTRAFSEVRPLESKSKLQLVVLHTGDGAAVARYMRYHSLSYVTWSKDLRWLCRV